MAEEITYTGMNMHPEYETLQELWLVTEWRDDHGVKAVYKTEKIGKAWVPMGATQGRRGEDTICVSSLSTNDSDIHTNPRRKAQDG